MPGGRDRRVPAPRGRRRRAPRAARAAGRRAAEPCDGGAPALSVPERSVRSSTLLVVLSHPDDELGCAGAIAAQVARADRVVLLWLTRGEMTEAFGPIPTEEVARRR
ncbi:MAG: hypothetical protein EXR95_04400 [Gemmatimonadetes bacterium]|nr:hypothetical protein [Gemmatimonadota bacterium]